MGSPAWWRVPGGPHLSRHRRHYGWAVGLGTSMVVYLALMLLRRREEAAD
ncbi:hypothetical protein ABZ876_29750 [Streptomyces sp. NPDC046931]